MGAKNFTFLAALIVLTVLAFALFLGCNKTEITGPMGPRPDIRIFTIVPTDIVPPDSALVTWSTLADDSVKIFPPGQKLTPTDSGQIYIKPTVPTLYSLVTYADGAKDSAAVQVVMTALAAKIDIFTMEPDTLVNGDTSVITWKTNQADSIVVNQGVGKLNPVDSGQASIVPLNTVSYRAIAYSIYGNETVTINVRVKKPTLVRTIGGAYYKGEMGSAQLSPALTFAVADANSVLLDNLWINLRATEGDGALIPTDSVLTNSMGFGNVSYNFSGLLGHAVIRANFRTVDTVFAYLRANTIIPGLGGQGQYILFNETLGDVRNFNGNPNSIDVDPNFFVNYANYESNLHVVFAINDANQDEIAQNTEDVLVTLLTTGYTGKTRDSIGIGSTYNQIKAVYGAPDTVEYDPAPPPALVIIYDSLGLVFFTNTVVGNPVDTNVTVFEIHASDFVSKRAAGKITLKNTNNPGQNPGPYRRIRRY